MSTDKLSMALEDVIKQDKNKKMGKKVGGGPGGQRRRNQTGGNNMRRNQSRGARQQSNSNLQRKKQVAPVRARRPARPNSGTKRPQQIRQSTYRRQRTQNIRPVAQRQSSQSGGDDSRKTILRITGLNFNIDLFTKIGPLKQCRIDFDEMGRSKGSAIVQYEKHIHAEKAIEEYNGADLDQKTLNVEYLKTEGSKRFNNNMPPVQRRIQKPPRNDNFRRQNNTGRQNFRRGGGNNNRNQGGNRMRTFRR